MSVLSFLCVALAVLLDFLLQVTAFVALMVFDFSRAEDNRIDCFPCIKGHSSATKSEEGTFNSTCFNRNRELMVILAEYSRSTYFFHYEIKYSNS